MKIFVLLVVVVACVQGSGAGLGQTFYDILGNNPEQWRVAEFCMEELAGTFSDPPTNPEKCQAVKHILECAGHAFPHPIRVGLRRYGRKEWGC